MKILCDLAHVSRSGFYKYLKHKNEKKKEYKDYLRIKEVFDVHNGTWGWRRIKMELPHMNHKKIQRIMRTYDLQARVRRRNPYKAVHRKMQEKTVSPNILNRAFIQTTPHRVFCTDITYLRFLEEFVYVSVIKDIASGEVVAWNASLHIDTLLVIETLKRLPEGIHAGALIHSDQGFQYTNMLYVEFLKQLDFIQSMSEKGTCLDNAPIESFFGHMKDELEYSDCTTFEELYVKIQEYMQYYNHERKQWNRNKMTPVEYRGYLLAEKTRV